MIKFNVFICKSFNGNYWDHGGFRMKKLVFVLCSLFFVSGAYANGSVIEGVITQSSPISGEVGEDGHPILGAAVGVGLGSLIGDGGGRTAAMVAGGLLGARSQQKEKQVMHGWQYVIQGKDDKLHSVNSWCSQPNTQCSGFMVGKEVYVVNGNQVTAK